MKLATQCWATEFALNLLWPKSYFNNFVRKFAYLHDFATVGKRNVKVDFFA